MTATEMEGHDAPVQRLAGSDLEAERDGDLGDHLRMPGVAAGAGADGMAVRCGLRYWYGPGDSAECNLSRGHSGSHANVFSYTASPAAVGGSLAKGGGRLAVAAAGVTAGNALPQTTPLTIANLDAQLQQVSEGIERVQRDMDAALAIFTHLRDGLREEVGR